MMCDDELGRVVYDCSSVMLLFGNDGAKLGRVAALAERAQCRVTGVCSIEEAETRLDQQVIARAAVVLADEPSSALERLLVRLQRDAQNGRLRPIVVAPVSMIDTVSGAGLTRFVDHQIDPADEDLVIALALASARVPAQLQDITRSNGADVLQQLSEEAARLASVLASLSSEENIVQAEPGAYGESREADQIGPGLVRSIIRARRLRDQYFRGDLFADPAWDVLLDLFAARLEESRVAVSSLCIAAAVPATTALRWIKALTDRGLLVRTADPQDGRRVYIELSADAAKAMGAYLTMAQRISPAII